MNGYEEPTNDLRQVRRSAGPGDGLSMIHDYLIVQRKWLIYDGIYDSGAAQFATAKEEWRDIPFVHKGQE